MEIEELKKTIRDNVKFQTVNPTKTGGQSCGYCSLRQRLYSEELNLTIETEYYANNLKNRQLLGKLFELAIDEIIK